MTSYLKSTLLSLRSYGLSNEILQVRKIIPLVSFTISFKDV